MSNFSFISLILSAVGFALALSAQPETYVVTEPAMEISKYMFAGGDPLFDAQMEY